VRFGIGEIVVVGLRRGIEMRMRMGIVKVFFFSVAFVSFIVFGHFFFFSFPFSVLFLCGMIDMIWECAMCVNVSQHHHSCAQIPSSFLLIHLLFGPISPFRFLDFHSSLQLGLLCISLPPPTY